jgi:hypothetical protein
MDLSFWFRAEATSRGVRVKNDLPIRSSFKSQNRGTAILAVGQAGILPADNQAFRRINDKETIMRINAC